MFTRWFCEVPTCTTLNRNFFFCRTNAGRPTITGRRRPHPRLRPGDNPDLALWKAKGRELVNDKVSHLGAVVLDNMARLTGRTRDDVPRDHEKTVAWAAARTEELHARSFSSARRVGPVGQRMPYQQVNAVAIDPTTAPEPTSSDCTESILPRIARRQSASGLHPISLSRAAGTGPARCHG